MIRTVGDLRAVLAECGDGVLVSVNNNDFIAEAQIVGSDPATLELVTGRSLGRTLDQAAAQLAAQDKSALTPPADLPSSDAVPDPDDTRDPASNR